MFLNAHVYVPVCLGAGFGVSRKYEVTVMIVKQSVNQ